MFISLILLFAEVKRSGDLGTKFVTLDLGTPLVVNINEGKWMFYSKSVLLREVLVKDVLVKEVLVKECPDVFISELLY